MFRNLSLILIISIIGISVACQTATAPSNTNSGAANATVILPANSANLPPEFAGNMSTVNSNAPIPGIPDPKTMNANNVPKGVTPTPGIPDPKELSKPQAKNTPKIEGIPTEKELKEMMNKKVDPSEVNNPKGLVPKPAASNTATNTTANTEVGKPLRKPKFNQ
jgi:hypothetical protein